MRRAGFPARGTSRGRKLTLTSMISHGRHDANEDEPGGNPKSDADETLSVSRAISGQRSILLISLARRAAASSFLSGVHVMAGRIPQSLPYRTNYSAAILAK